MPVIERRVLLPATADAVWRALTESDELSRWFGCPVELEPRPGGRITVGEGPDARRGLVEEFEPHRRLAVRWLPGPRPGVPRTRVEFVLEGGPEGTLLTVVESPLWSEAPHPDTLARVS